jgi:hypothetical protein
VFIAPNAPLLINIDDAEAAALRQLANDLTQLKARARRCSSAAAMRRSTSPAVM